MKIKIIIYLILDLFKLNYFDILGIGDWGLGVWGFGGGGQTTTTKTKKPKPNNKKEI